MFMELHREEKREEGDRGGQEDKRGNQKERDRYSHLSCIFSILVSQLFICNSILFLRLSIIFSIIIRNSLLGRFPISSSFFLVWWAFIPFLYLLSISLPFHLVYIAVFGVTFLYSGSLSFLFIVEVPLCGWSWMGGLSRFPG